MKMSDEPRLAGWLGLPSIFVGRPSCDSTSTPTPTPPSCIVDAYDRGLPGTISSGIVT